MILVPVLYRLVPVVATFLQSGIPIQSCEHLECRSYPTSTHNSIRNKSLRYLRQRRLLSFPHNMVGGQGTWGPYNSNLSQFSGRTFMDVSMYGFPCSESPNLHSSEADINDSYHLLPQRERFARTLKATHPLTTSTAPRDHSDGTNHREGPEYILLDATLVLYCNVLAYPHMSAKSQ